MERGEGGEKRLFKPMIEIVTQYGDSHDPFEFLKAKMGRKP